MLVEPAIAAALLLKCIEFGSITPTSEFTASVPPQGIQVDMKKPVYKARTIGGTIYIFSGAPGARSCGLAVYGGDVDSYRRSTTRYITTAKWGYTRFGIAKLAEDGVSIYDRFRRTDSDSGAEVVLITKSSSRHSPPSFIAWGPQVPAR